MTLFHLTVLLLALVSYLSVYITVRFIIHSFQCSTYNVLYFHISILLFPLLVCALVGPLLTDLDFSTSELKETEEPLFEGTRKIIRHESNISCLIYFGILSCYDVPMPKLYLLFFLLCYSNLISRQRLS